MSSGFNEFGVTFPHKWEYFGEKKTPRHGPERPKTLVDAGRARQDSNLRPTD
jgi:hypothetical protein